MSGLSPTAAADRHEAIWRADDEADAPPPRRHREVLAASILALALAFAMVEVPGGRVALRGWTAHPLPETCGAKSLFGVRCPGCGLTRSFIHLAEGDWRASWRSHRLGWLIAGLVVLQLPYRAMALRRPGRWTLPARWTVRIATSVIALLLANWLLEVVIGRGASL